MQAHQDSALIDRVGTTTQVALLFRVRPQAVSQWRRKGIPDARKQTLELMRPDLFAEIAGAQSDDANDARPLDE